jgi:hypothetical protein
MTVQTDSFLLAGGLDLVTPYYLVAKGRLLQGLNLECLPQGGYSKIQGYVLHDGSDTPAAVPGEGPIRGVWMFESELYAFRDQATSGGMFKATASGWQAQSLGFSLNYDTGSGEFVEGETVNGATSGAAATVLRVVNLAGLTDNATASGLLVLGSIIGTFQDNEDLRNGASVITAKANGSQYANTLAKGGHYRFVNANFYGGLSTRRMYAAYGAGAAFEWDGALFAPIPIKADTDWPEFIEAHKEHLFLGFRRGSIQHSGVAEPLDFAPLSGAGEIALGDELRAMRLLVGGVLAFGCKQSMKLLYGNDAETWQLQQLYDSGIRENTLMEVAGNVVYFDDRGLQTLQATQAFGDFASGALSVDINPALLSLAQSGVAAYATISRNKTQYRLFFGTKAFYLTFNGNRPVGFTEVSFAHPVLCAVAGENALGTESLFFGTNDGLVCQLDQGNFFNGQPIQVAFRLPYNFAGQVTRRKQYRKALLDITVSGPGSLSLLGRADFDFGASGARNTTLPETPVQGSDSGNWGTAVWNEFSWAVDSRAAASLEIDGIGDNMSLYLFNAGETDNNFQLYGLTLHYSLRRLNR